MDEYLDGLSKIVHEALKRLKLEQTGTIQCSKDYPAQEVLLYVQAYGLHKRKWFEAKYDKAANVVYAKRGTPPPWDTPEQIDAEEEL